MERGIGAGSRADGFTLVELLIVIAIISILAAMLLPTIERSIEQSRRIVCLQNLHQQHIIAVLYADEWTGHLPRGLGGYNGNPMSADNIWWSQWRFQNKGGTGLYVFIKHGYLLIGDTLRCPSQDFNMLNVNNANDKRTYLPSGVSYSWLNYSFRYNTDDSTSNDHYPTGLKYAKNALSNPKSARKILFTDKIEKTVTDGGVIRNRTVFNGGVATANQSRWAHLEGGNMVFHNGSGRFRANGSLARWPTSHFRGRFWLVEDWLKL